MELNRISIIIAIATVMLAAVQTAQAKMYRWVDEQGNVHYSDRVPPTQTKKSGHEVIEESSGRVVDKVDRQKTPAEIEAERERLAVEEKQRKREEEQAKRDHALLQTFTTENDLILARDDRLATVDSAIRIAEDRLENLEQQELDLVQRAKYFKTEVKPVPEWLTNKLADTRRRIESSQAYLKQKRGDREAVEESFESDIARFRELKAARAQAVKTKP